jgi:hypothetical protein
MQAARFLMLVGAASWAADPFGTWKCTGESLTLCIAPHPRGEVFTMDTVAADGRALTSSTILYFDGKPRDFPDPSCSGTQSSRRVDARTVEILRKCAGGETRLIHRLASQPGALILDITEQHSDGRSSKRHLVLAIGGNIRC